MKNIVTIVISTFNEEKNIKDCIASAKILSDYIQVIDMESTDKTVSIASKEHVKIYSFPPTQYVEPARGYSIEKAESDWVFILDADERITPELAEEIKSVIQNQKYSYYKLARKNIFGNQWLKHGGWWPDYQIRLIYKPSFLKWPKEIHSTPEIDGEQGFLKEPLLHYFHGDFEQMVNKTILFENIESNLLYKAHKSVSTATFFRKFFGELFRRLFKNFGFLDGDIGIIESIYQAFSKTITYLFLYEKSKKNLPAGRQGRSL